jgi:hypothetical protein
MTEETDTETLNISSRGVRRMRGVATQMIGTTGSLLWDLRATEIKIQVNNFMAITLLEMFHVHAKKRK